MVSTATVPHCTTATVKPSTVDLPRTESDRGKSKLTFCFFDFPALVRLPSKSYRKSHEASYSINANVQHGLRVGRNATAVKCQCLRHGPHVGLAWASRGPHMGYYVFIAWASLWLVLTIFNILYHSLITKDVRPML